MTEIIHDVKTVNGVPTMTEEQIESILSFNPMREKPATRETLLSSLENLKTVYAEHTGFKGVKTSDHEPCMGLDGKCGSVDFIRTGTCYVCLNCSTSQGCS